MQVERNNLSLTVVMNRKNYLAPTPYISWFSWRKMVLRFFGLEREIVDIDTEQHKIISGNIIYTQWSSWPNINY